MASGSSVKCSVKAKFQKEQDLLKVTETRFQGVEVKFEMYNILQNNWR